MFSFFKRMPRLETHGITHPGKVRPNNEDSMLLLPDKGFFCVADGMGGASAGEIASQLFVNQATLSISKPSKDHEEASRLVKEIFWKANSIIREHAKSNPSHSGLGCTAEVLSFYPNGYLLGHVGDSRTYLFRKNKLKQLTKDHSLVRQQLEQGLISLEEAQSHPMRNVILRAVGVQEELAVDLIKGSYKSGDMFLLCSDGLSDMLSDSVIAKVLLLQLPVAELCAKLVDMANQAGGRDNITVIVIRIV